MRALGDEVEDSCDLRLLTWDHGVGLCPASAASWRDAFEGVVELENLDVVGPTQFVRSLRTFWGDCLNLSMVLRFKPLPKARLIEFNKSEGF